jgi:hypothetical protein
VWEAAATLAVACVGGIAYLVGLYVGQDRRITKLEERVKSLGQQMFNLPKRRSD